IPLHRLAKVMGYRVTVIDARAKFATRERFPEADELLVSWPDEGLGKLTLDRSAYVVVLTHDPKFDLPALRSVLKKDVGYIGAIGGPSGYASIPVEKPSRLNGVVKRWRALAYEFIRVKASAMPDMVSPYASAARAWSWPTSR